VRSAIGAEFLRWEVATATAGWLLGINPFDEPNVKQAKGRDECAAEEVPVDGRLPHANPTGEIADAPPDADQRCYEGARTAAAPSASSDVVHGRRLFRLLAYLPPDREPFDSALHGSVPRSAKRFRARRCSGTGRGICTPPGSCTKAAPTDGVFIIVTADVQEDLRFPASRFHSACSRWRRRWGISNRSTDRPRALHVHLPRRMSIC
jgi:hypothetical protein